MKPERTQLKARQLANPEQARANALQKILDLREAAARLIQESAPAHFLDAAFHLCRMRAAIAENLNQLPHAVLILEAQRQLAEHRDFQGLDWFWHPHQTHGDFETDLMGWRGNDLVAVVEASTSAKAEGTLKPRIAKAVGNLAKVEHPAKRFFYCYTTSCAEWARGIATSSYPEKAIAVVVLAKEPLPC
ncbi:MAG: hypothetical protein WDN28_10315 [Chthoniobacter sp.]